MQSWSVITEHPSSWPALRAREYFSSLLFVAIAASTSFSYAVFPVAWPPRLLLPPPRRLPASQRSSLEEGFLSLPSSKSANQRGGHCCSRELPDAVSEMAALT